MQDRACARDSISASSSGSTRLLQRGETHREHTADAPLRRDATLRLPFVAHRVLPPFPFPEIFTIHRGTITLRKRRLRNPTSRRTETRLACVTSRTYLIRYATLGFFLINSTRQLRLEDTERRGMRETRRTDREEAKTMLERSERSSRNENGE